MVDVTVATSYIHMLLIIYTAYDQQHKKHLISDKITVIPRILDPLDLSSSACGQEQPLSSAVAASVDQPFFWIEI